MSSLMKLTQVDKLVDKSTRICIILSAETDNVTFAQGLFISPTVTNQPNTFGAKVPVFTLSQRGSPACYSSVSATKSSVEAGIFSFQEFSEMEEQEIWKPIPGHPGYEVSNLGRVKSLKRKTPSILRPSLSKEYLGVGLGRGIYKRIHRLVMLTFVGPCPEGQEVCHNDGNPANNRLDNLRYDTHKANMVDFSKLGRRDTPEGKAEQIRVLFHKGVTISKLSRIYKISRTAIWNIIRGRTYRLAPGPIVLDSVTRARNIREEYAVGKTNLSKLANKYRMDQSAVSRIVNGQSCISAGGPIKGVDY